MNNQHKGEKFFAKTIVAAIAFALALATLMACEETSKQNSFTDARDGKKYKIVKIGTQTWMAENLNYEAGGSVCYDNKPENCTKYGSLYYWETAMKVCPQGWHLPSKDEWQILVDFAGGDKVAGGKFKTEDGWKDGGGDTNEYGFSTLAGGCYDNGETLETGGYFSDAGDSGYWWSSSEYDAYHAYFRYMYYNDEYVNSNYYLKSAGYSVRCVQDSKN